MINIFKKTWWKKDVTNPLEKDSEVPSTNNHFKWKLFNLSKGSPGKALSYPTWQGKLKSMLMFGETLVIDLDTQVC